MRARGTGLERLARAGITTRRWILGAGLPRSRNAEIRTRRSSVSNIILPLDGRELSRVAIPVARGLAELYGATLHVVYAGEPTLDPDLRLGRLGARWEEIPGAVVDQSSEAAPELIERSAKELPEALIVMCTRTGSSSKPDCFGTVTETVLASNPGRVVLLAPDRYERQFKVSRVVLAHDGTPTCDVAAAPAAEIALRAGAELFVLHVAAPRAGISKEAGSVPAPQYVDQPQHEWPSWAGEFMSRMLALGAPASSIRFKLAVTGGQPGSEVAQFSRKQDTDLVVMANSGDWASCKNMAIRVVILTCGCPVLLVPTKERPESVLEAAGPW